MTDTKTSILKELREAAAKCSNMEYRLALKEAADRLSGRIAVLDLNPTRHNMELVNGLWAHAERLLKNLPPEADPQPPLAGTSEPTKLAA